MATKSIKLFCRVDHVYRDDSNQGIEAKLTYCGEFDNCKAVSLKTSKGTYLITSTLVGRHHQGPAVYKGYAGKYSITITLPAYGEMLVEWEEKEEPKAPVRSAGYEAARAALSRRFEPIGAPAFLRGTWGR